MMNIIEKIELIKLKIESQFNEVQVSQIINWTHDIMVKGITYEAKLKEEYP